MSSLVLELKQGETMILNGAFIRFQTKTRLELHGHARFLFGKQLLHAHEVTSPVREVYYALQQAYLGPDEDREVALQHVHDMISRHQQQNADGLNWVGLRELCVEPTLLAALKLGRQMIQLEDNIASRATVLGMSG